MSIRLFITDTDANHVDCISRSVARCPDIHIIGSGENGAHVLRQLSVTPADMLITEIQLPGLDGLMLLKELQGLRIRPVAIVCTLFYAPICVSKARAYGADYFMYKPLDYSRLPEIIRECHRARLQSASETRAPTRPGEARSREAMIRALLTELGMPARLTGSLYLTEALTAADENPMLLKNLSKGLYAEVAARTQSTPARLERSLRNAIRIACERGGLDRHFGHPPTNREFLMYMMEQLAMRKAY